MFIPNSSFSFGKIQNKSGITNIIRKIYTDTSENPALRIAAASFCRAKDIAESLTPR